MVNEDRLTEGQELLAGEIVLRVICAPSRNDEFWVTQAVTNVIKSWKGGHFLLVRPLEGLGFFVVVLAYEGPIKILAV